MLIPSRILPSHRQAREATASKSGVTVCSVHPGFIETELSRAQRPGGRDPAEAGAGSPLQGAASPCFCMFHPDVLHGWFYGADSKRSPLDRKRHPGDPPFRGDEE